VAGTLFTFGMIFVSEKEKAGEGSRRQGADSYETHDSRRVTVGQGESRLNLESPKSTDACGKIRK
jgi:hypothetical protein